MENKAADELLMLRSKMLFYTSKVNVASKRRHYDLYLFISLRFLNLIDFVRVSAALWRLKFNTIECCTSSYSRPKRRNCVVKMKFSKCFNSRTAYHKVFKMIADFKGTSNFISTFWQYYCSYT